MDISKDWLPFNFQIHEGMRTVLRCDEGQRYMVLLRARDEQGRVFKEHVWNDGEPLQGVASIELDHAFLQPSIRDGQKGLIETILLSDRPYKKDRYHYYLRGGGFTHVVYTPPSSINHSGRPHRYHGFSVHFVDSTVQSCGLVLMNISTKNDYARAASYQYEIFDPSGHVVQGGRAEIAPFGTYWLALEDRLLGAASPTMYTCFGRCDGSALMSLIYTVSTDGGLGIDHTQPSVQQLNYGDRAPADLKQRYIRFRQHVSQAIRYRLNRVDENPLWQLGSHRRTQRPPR